LEDVPSGTGLGDLKFVAEGLLLMIRPKLYVMFSGRIAEQVEKYGGLRVYLKTRDISSLMFWGSEQKIESTDERARTFRSE